MPSHAAMKLNVHAPPFYPTLGWKTAITDDVIQAFNIPYSPAVVNADGFVILDQEFYTREVPDEELFDPAFYPFTQTDLRELEACDQMNELLADLELLDMQEELHRKLADKCHELKDNRRSQESTIWNILMKTSKDEEAAFRALRNKKLTPTHQQHAKSPRFSRGLNQPRHCN
ncbi:hypothetical protein DYB37_005758 [Aphanomyces astaci]|uniref:Uncharacterized protein n=3 Tax=Aphanomyces astaci TaxID=112090 RepID=A0A418D154_APHAT|nr:hypothetical protein DYB35_007840 [Aphanomyces astaci]RHZ19742.1 hypothetical protein DYB37_005758 [Aphanomyces astaci]